MREREAIDSKVVSQALFGEEIQIQKQAGEWLQIKTPDGYLGWILAHQCIARKKTYEKDLEVTRISAHLYAQPDTEYGPLLTLPFGSPLQLTQDFDARWYKIQLPQGEEAFIQKGDVAPEKSDLFTLGQKFLGLPYTWGGRSSFGFDCSGFIQMLFRRQGIALPRDASQQIEVGEAISFTQVRPGDLLFWGLSEKEIRHVGMSLEPPLFIHTSARENRPYLRISSLQDPEWNGRAFYSYRAARRILPR